MQHIGSYKIEVWILLPDLKPEYSKAPKGLNISAMGVAHQKWQVIFLSPERA